MVTKKIQYFRPRPAVVQAMKDNADNCNYDYLYFCLWRALFEAIDNEDGTKWRYEVKECLTLLQRQLYTKLSQKIDEIYNEWADDE